MSMPSGQKWIQIGLSKSGNVWLYHILQGIRRQAGFDERSFIRTQPIHPIAKTWELAFPEQADIDTLVINPSQCLYRISSIFSMPIGDIDAYVGATTHVWTHSPYSPLAGRVLPKFDRVLYIVRDPRDVAVSLSRFNFTPYRLQYYPPAEPDPAAFLEARFGETVRQWTEHVGGYLAKKEALGIHFVFYERLLADFDRELGALLDYLGVVLSPESRGAIKKAVSFESMKADRPVHLRKGESGQWRDSLKPSQIRAAGRITGGLLEMLHYNATGLPALPERIDRRRIEVSLRCAGHKRYWEKAARALRSLRQS